MNFIAEYFWWICWILILIFGYLLLTSRSEPEASPIELERDAFRRCLLKKWTVLTTKEMDCFNQLLIHVSSLWFQIFPKVRLSDLVGFDKTQGDYQWVLNKLSGKRIDFLVVDSFWYWHTCIDLIHPGEPMDETKKYACQKAGLNYQTLPYAKKYSFSFLGHMQTPYSQGVNDSRNME